MTRSKKNYRSKIRITFEILKNVGEIPVMISVLCRKTNLAHYAVLEVVNALEHKGFVLTQIEQKSRIISITQEGRKLLDIFERFDTELHKIGWKFT